MKKIVISAINLYEGGPLSVLKDCLYAIENSNQFVDCEFLALVHKKSLFEENNYKKVVFVEFPKSRKSYLYRLYYEYFYFKKFAKNHKINFWFSLHDISPNIGAVPQAVYCHNPSPFKEFNFQDLFVQPVVFMFNLFYSFLYKININNNKYVVVQQLWLKEEFHRRYEVEYDRIVIARPNVPKIVIDNPEVILKNEKLFVFPTYPRSFKNIEIIGEAVKILNKQGIANFSVSVTIDGSENKYSRIICKKYSKIKGLNFIGLQSREAVYELYNDSDCLIFPSILETWGLPINEYKQFNKAIIVADLPYAKETVGGYDKAIFFNPHDSFSLANYMKKIILSIDVKYSKTQEIVYPKPYVQNWEQLLLLLINEQDYKKR